MSIMRNLTKWRAVLAPCAALCLLISAFGCKKGGQGQGQPGAAAKVEAAPRAASEVEPTNAPVLGLMVDGLGEVDTYPGWPVLIDLDLSHPDLYQQDKKVEPFLIASAGESWAGTVSLSLKDSQGRGMHLPLKLVSPEEASLKLDAENMATLSWWILGPDTQALSEGDYQLAATLDTSGVKKPGVWRGKVVSEPAILHVKPEPTSLPDKLAEQKLVLLAGCAQAMGDTAKAKEYTDELLKGKPDSIQGLILKAGLLEKASDKMSALDVYDQAIAIFRKKYPQSDPPADLFREHKRLIDELLNKKTFKE